MSIIFNGNANVGILQLITDLPNETATSFTIASSGEFSASLHMQATYQGANWGGGILKVMSKNSDPLLIPIDYSQGGYTENKRVEMYCVAGVEYSFVVENAPIQNLVISITGKRLQFIS